MSELSNKIQSILGDMKAVAAGKLCDLSRESFYRIERGESVGYETLLKIKKGFKLNQNDWLELLVAWLKQEAGADAPYLIIQAREVSPSMLRDNEASQVAKAMMLFTDLNLADRQEVTHAMQRPEVRACLPAINSLYEKLGTSGTPAPINSKTTADAIHLVNLLSRTLQPAADAAITTPVRE